MAKNFGKAGSAKAFENTKRIEQEKATVEAIRTVRIENLVPNPNNDRDVSYTLDIENSINANGFNDNLVVTDFGMEEGKYMIVVGHRRTEAAKKLGFEALPCRVVHFNSQTEVNGYTLRANCNRDVWEPESQKWVRAYSLHKQYVEEGFEGNIHERIAEDMNTTVSTVYRWLAMQEVIKPVWTMVDGGVVGFSSVQPLAQMDEDGQKAIYKIMQEAIEKGVERLTRDMVKKIVDGFKKGKTTWAEIADLPRDSGLPLNGFMNTEPSESREQTESGSRSDEVRHDADPIAAEYDAMDADRAEWERQQEEAANSEDADEQDEDKGGKDEKHELTPEEKQIKLGNDLAKTLNKADSIMQNIWKCEDEESARNMVINMSSVAQAIVDEIYRVCEEWNIGEEQSKALEDIKSAVEQYN